MSSEYAEHASEAKCDSTPFEEKEFVDFLTKHDRRDVPGTGIAKLVGQLIPQSLCHSARVAHLKD
jgi:hypothetical protein